MILDQMSLRSTEYYRIKKIIYEINESNIFNEYRIKCKYDRIIESIEINGIESNEI